MMNNKEGRNATDSQPLIPYSSLTLRGQRDRLQLTQLVESGVQGSNIELGLEGKVVKLGGGPQLFKFAKRTQRSEEMIGLSDHSLSRRFGQRGILLQRLVIAFHVPSFLIAGGAVGEGQGGIAGDHIQHPCAAILVCEDWLDQQEREGDAFPIHR